MAEGGGAENGKNTMPVRGKVKKVREEWAVHEDGAFAYQLQNEEINRHYGMNRFNRRTVREDIPIAKIVQTDEEVKQQNERFEQLQALRAQAEEDERIAKQMMEQEQLQTQAHKMAIELTDEEFAKAVQEKEKQKYERHLEKKKLQKLKKEREKIEKIQAQRTEEARLNVRPGSTEELNTQMTDLNLQNGGAALRVTPGGRIEDDGDFSDFYNLPEHVDPAHRQALQEMQDEELAKLLQEQEHKRTKAEVDRNKLREIEEQDKRLAQIIEEQEKIRLKKAKQKWKQQQELKRSQEAAQRPPALPPRNQEHDHRRYRRNSFIQSMENGPEQNEGDDLSPHSLASSEEYLTPLQAADQRNQASQGPRSNSNRQASSDNLLNNSVKQTNEIKQNNQNVQKIRNNTQGPNRAQNVAPSQLPSQEMPDVERWLASHPPDASRGRLPSEDYIPDSPSPPGSYHSEDAFPYRGMSHSPPHNTSTDTGSHYAVSDPFNFNIAAAIDPTYTRRNTDTNTDRKQVINHGGRSLPQDGHTINTVSSRGDSFHDDGPGVVSPFVPVQGQRRNMGERQKKSSRNQPGHMSDKQKNNCKQQ